MLAKFLTELYKRGLFQAATAYLVSAWAIAKIAELGTAKFGAPDWVMLGVLVVLFAGFPVVLVLSWFYDFKALEFNFDDADGDFEKPEAGFSGSVRTVSQTAPDEKSIAVLPFANISADPENEYFADGLSEELLNLLTKVSELKVSARTSSFAFKGKNEDIRKMAEKLNVAHVLEGSVRRSANSVRITAQLIQASDGYHLWSETYDRKLDDIFALQDEIATAVVDNLKINLLGRELQVYETDPTAFALYLEGKQLLEQRDGGSLGRAMDAFQQALALDPDYPAALLGLAGVYIARMSNSEIPPGEGIPKTRELIDHALLADKDCPDANSTSSFFAGAFEGDWPAALEAADHALQMSAGDARVLRRVAGVMVYSGDNQRCIDLAQQAVKVDPLNASGFHNLGFALLRAGRWPEARTALHQALQLADKLDGTRSGLGIIALMEGNPALALEDVAGEVDPIRRDVVTILAHHAMGREKEAAVALETFIEQYRDVGSYEIAEIYAHSGRPDSAFEWLERAIEKGDQGINTMSADPLLKNMDSDARWTTIREKAGLPEPCD